MLSPVTYWCSGGSILHRYGGPGGFQTEHLSDAQAKERFEWFAKTALEFEDAGDHEAARYCAKVASSIHDARQAAARWKAASNIIAGLPANVIQLRQREGA